MSDWIETNGERPDLPGSARISDVRYSSGRERMGFAHHTVDSLWAYGVKRPDITHIRLHRHAPVNAVQEPAKVCCWCGNSARTDIRHGQLICLAIRPKGGDAHDAQKGSPLDVTGAGASVITPPKRTRNEYGLRVRPWDSPPAREPLAFPMDLNAWKAMR